MTEQPQNRGASMMDQAHPWPIVARPASKSQKGVTHTVRRSPGGTLWCSCQRYFFSKAFDKSCLRTDEQVTLEERLAIVEEGRASNDCHAR